MGQCRFRVSAEAGNGNRLVGQPGEPAVSGVGIGGPSIEGTVQQLERRAARLLPRMGSRARPVFIEFAGTPKAGKTTIAQNLALFLRRNGFRCALMVEPASVAPFPSKRDMRFNIWTACRALTQMLEYVESDAGIVVMDRGLFDALCWTEMLEMMGEIEEAEGTAVRRFLMLERWRTLVDVVFLFHTTPGLALRHEFANALTRKAGSIMNEGMLARLNGAAGRVAERAAGDFEIVRMDMAGRTLLSGAEEVVRRTLSVLDSRLAEPASVRERIAAGAHGRRRQVLTAV